MDFELYRSYYLEFSKRIGVPNLALEQAERKLQILQDPKRPPTMDQLLEAVEAFGAAKFSCAHEQRADLFSSAEQGMDMLRTLIKESDR